MRQVLPFPQPDVHVRGWTYYFQELFLHLLVKITSAIQEANLPLKTKYTLMTLSGMAMAVVQEAAASGSTLHRGPASNSPSLHSDDIELRLCADQSIGNEDDLIELVELYVQ